MTALVFALLWTPWLLPTALRLALSKAWRRDLVAARGKVSKISFFIHNFMSACSLERDRVAACAFMVATADGPISMCLHNARRDDFLLRPLPIRQRASAIFWNPVTGRLQNDPHPVQAPILPPKLRKGRDVLDTTAPTTENR